MGAARADSGRLPDDGIEPGVMFRSFKDFIY